MSEDQRLGALHWIDHYAVPTSDLDRWISWNAEVLGAVEPWGSGAGGPPGLGPVAAFRILGGAHVAGFAQKEPIPASKGLGKNYPRYGVYVRSEDVEEHLRRLDRLGVNHSEAMRTSQEGEPGVAVYFEDPDENQLELWAPDHLQEGAMDGASSVGVGRISHCVFESRDLDRTAAFFDRYLGLDPLSSADVPQDTLVMPMVAGGRIIYRKVEELGVRSGGSTLWRGVHSAFVCREDEFMPAYEKMWAELPEWDYDQAEQGPLSSDPGALGARTGMHGSAAGRKWKALYGRGDQIYDWDTNNFHLVGGIASTPTLARYQARYMEDRLHEVIESRLGGDPS